MTSQNQGLGLVEVMIGLLLSSLILSGLVHHFIQSKSEYMFLHTQIENTLERSLLENLIRDSIKSAGFTPCIGLNHLKTMDTREFQPLHAVLLKNNELVINHMSEQFSFVSIENPVELKVPQGTYTLDKAVIIADCFHAEVQKIMETSNRHNEQILHLFHPLYYKYTPPVYIGEWISEHFFVKSETLYYQLQRIDKLYDPIHSIQVSYASKEKNTLDINLRFPDHKNIDIHAWIRST